MPRSSCSTKTCPNFQLSRVPKRATRRHSSCKLANSSSAWTLDTSWSPVHSPWSTVHSGLISAFWPFHSALSAILPFSFGGSFCERECRIYDGSIRSIRRPVGCVDAPVDSSESKASCSRGPCHCVECRVRKLAGCGGTWPADECLSKLNILEPKNERIELRCPARFQVFR